MTDRADQGYTATEVAQWLEQGRLRPGQRVPGGYQVLEAPPGRILVKRARGRGLAAGARAAMIRREYDMYRRLSGVSGVPRCYGLVDGDQLVLEWIEGESLRDRPASEAERDSFFQKLLQVIRDMHRAGVAHADLKRRDNVLQTPNGEPYVIDFGAAVSLDENSGPIARWIFQAVVQMDLNAWVKLKYRSHLDQMTDAERALYRPTTIENTARAVRRFWRTITARQFRRR